MQPSTSRSPGTRLRFGSYEVDPEAGELRKHGIRIRLQEQPFRVLLALLKRPGEVVTREELRKSIWGAGAVGDTDHGISAAVNRLRQAIGDSAEHPRYIETLSRRGYRWIAPVAVGGGTSLPEEVTRPLPRRRPKLAHATVAIAVVVAILSWTGRTNKQSPGPGMRRLTALTGSEGCPAISRESKLLAFCWAGENDDNFDVYVTAPGDANMLRLTDDPAIDAMPSWSPDEKQIAFVSSRDGGGIYVVSPLGGPCRKLAAIPSDTPPAWLRDGKHILVAKSGWRSQAEADDGAVYLVPANGSCEPRIILRPAAGTWYRDPALSPDGRQLAVALCAGPGANARVCNVVTLPFGKDMQAASPARTVAAKIRGLTGLAWAPSADTLVVGGSEAGRFCLWRVRLRDGTGLERIETGVSDAFHPATDATSRIAFVQSSTQTDVWRWTRGTASPFLTSSVRDANPQFSPDGRRIAFESSRSGEGIQIWVANADGSGLAQLTRGFSEQCGSPAWSPDGTRLAFDSYGRDHRWNVWLMDAKGGNQRAVTNGAGDNAAPVWSRDGTAIYFFSNRSGRPEIWRAPALGGPATKVTRNGAYTASESYDGKSLYFTKSSDAADGLYAMSLTTGEETHIISEPIAPRTVAITDAGIYHLASKRRDPVARIWAPLFAGSPQAMRFEIRLYDVRNGRSRAIGEVDGPIHLGLAVSPDKRTFLFSRAISAADIMLIEKLD